MPDFADTSDVLNLSTSLRQHSINRVAFDPSLESHLESFRVFLRTGNWGDIQFYCEHPFTDVPMTVLMKAAMYTEGVTRETRVEQMERLATKNLVPFLPAESAEAKAKRLMETNLKLGFSPDGGNATEAELAALS